MGHFFQYKALYDDANGGIIPTKCVLESYKDTFNNIRIRTTLHAKDVVYLTIYKI